MQRLLFFPPHPLHDGVGGLPRELAQVTAQEVRDFAARLLVPSNALLIIAGVFTPAVAEELARSTVGRVPGGQRAPDPAVANLLHTKVESFSERVWSEPRVTSAWRLGGLTHDEALVLRLGSQLLMLRTDTAFGMRVHASVEELGGEIVFTYNLSVPYDEPASAVQNDAVAMLRQLTARDIPFDTLLYTNLALERQTLGVLDTLPGCVDLLDGVERLFAGKVSVRQEAGAHWRIEPVVIHHTARELLDRPHVTVHERPERPRAARREIQ